MSQLVDEKSKADQIKTAATQDTCQQGRNMSNTGDDRKTTEAKNVTEATEELTLLCSHRPPRNCAEGGVSIRGLRSGALRRSGAQASNECLELDGHVTDLGEDLQSCTVSRDQTERDVDELCAEFSWTKLEWCAAAIHCTGLEEEEKDEDEARVQRKHKSKTRATVSRQPHTDDWWQAPSDDSRETPTEDWSDTPKGDRSHDPKGDWSKTPRGDPHQPPRDDGHQPSEDDWHQPSEDDWHQPSRDDRHQPSGDDTCSPSRGDVRMGSRYTWHLFAQHDLRQSKAGNRCQIASSDRYQPERGNRHQAGQADRSQRARSDWSETARHNWRSPPRDDWSQTPSSKWHQTSRRDWGQTPRGDWNQSPSGAWSKTPQRQRRQSPRGDWSPNPRNEWCKDETGEWIQNTRGDWSQTPSGNWRQTPRGDPNQTQGDDRHQTQRLNLRRTPQDNLHQPADDGKRQNEKDDTLQPPRSRQAQSPADNVHKSAPNDLSMTGNQSVGQVICRKSIDNDDACQTAKGNLHQSEDVRHFKQDQDDDSEEEEDEDTDTDSDEDDGYELPLVGPLNSDLKPSQTFSCYWLREENFLNRRLYGDYGDWDGGKWMTFHHVSEIDDAWERARHLYRTGQLPGIPVMYCCTSVPEPVWAHKPKTVKVICYYCGPYYDKPKMFQIGRMVAERMNYRANHIAFRTDIQSDLYPGISGGFYRIYRNRHQ